MRTFVLSAAATAALTTAGCGDADRPAPRTPPATSAPASPSAKPTHTKPALAGPGTTCGKVVTPAKHAAKVVLAKGHLRCRTAVAVVKKYYRGVQAGKGGGNSAALRVGKFFCASTTAAGASTGNLGSCNTKDSTLRIKIKAHA